MDPASAFSFDMSYCGSPPTLDTLLGRWNLDPVLLLVLVTLAFGAAVVLRRADRYRQLAFGGAWLLAMILFVSPICAASVALLWVRVTHHIVLTMVVAPLVALALPTRWARPMRMLPALAGSTMAMWLWHAPDLYASAFTHPAIYWAMQASLLGSFTWLWLGLLRKDGAMTAGTAALLSAMQMGFLGALLVFAPGALYLPHRATTFAFGLTPLADQQLAGLVMWVPANLPLLALVLWRLAGALRPRGASPG